MALDEAVFPDSIGDKLSPIIITGACRSGKTTLGNVLASCPQVEYADEPYTGMLLPMVSGTGLINNNIAKSWMKVYLRELFNDLVLLRRANFRKQDLSSIWEKKEKEEITYRMNNLNSRKDVDDYIARKNLRLVVTLTECFPFLMFMDSALNNPSFIHVVRNGYDVAIDLEKKKWFSDEQLIEPVNAQLYIPYQWKGSSWHIPWWVDREDFNFFLNLNLFDRGIYYWCSLMEKSLRSLSEYSREFIQVKYEDLVTKPASIMEDIIDRFNFTKGVQTMNQLKKLQERSVASERKLDVHPKLNEKFRYLQSELKYV